MKINLTIVFFMLCLISCHEKTDNNFKKLILGDWEFYKEKNKVENIFYESFGYSFYENGFVENKPGFFNRDNKTTFYFGTKTKFEIKRDSLEIFNLITKKWDRAKIVSVNKDTLKLIFDKNVTLIFLKKNYKLNPKISFDKVIVSMSPCFGTCPMNSTIIDKSGEAIFQGEAYNSVNGTYQFKITLSEFNNLENNFRKSNFLGINDNYEANWTDDQTITTTFIRNDSIIKTISDYGRQSPADFQWASKPVSFLYQTHKLKALNFPEYLNLGWCRILKGNKIAQLSQSEHFYLLCLLNESKVVDNIFNEKYKIVCHSENVKMITSDGRFFKFVLNNDREIILDLGFDFFERNKEKIKFLKLTKQDIENYI